VAEEEGPEGSLGRRPPNNKASSGGKSDRRVLPKGRGMKQKSPGKVENSLKTNWSGGGGLGMRGPFLRNTEVGPGGKRESRGGGGKPGRSPPFA